MGFEDEDKDTDDYYKVGDDDFEDDNYSFIIVLQLLSLLMKTKMITPILLLLCLPGVFVDEDNYDAVMKITYDDGGNADNKMGNDDDNGDDIDVVAVAIAGNDYEVMTIISAPTTIIMTTMMMTTMMAMVTTMIIIMMKTIMTTMTIKMTI